MESNVGKSPVFNLYPPHMCPQADSYTQPPQPPPHTHTENKKGGNLESVAKAQDTMLEMGPDI